MVLTNIDIVKYQYRSAAAMLPSTRRTTVLTYHSLVAATLRERERELEDWSLGRLATRIRDCCRPGRLERMTRLAARVLPQRCCVEGAAS